MEYIDLYLKEREEGKEERFLLEEIIEKEDLIIILGVPGSGKSTLLEKYKKENETNSKFLEVEEFLDDEEVKEEIEVLLLDALDEYRSTEDKKNSVVRKLAKKLKEMREKNQNLKIVLSCRELDWDGESDKSFLEKKLGESSSKIYNLEKLTEEQQIELMDLKKVEEREEFIKKFKNRGFFENIQMFTMLIDLWGKKENRNKIKSSIDLYSLFISKSRESNKTRRWNKQNDIEENEQLKIVGYIACFYIFSGAKEFDEEFIDEVRDKEKKYSKEKIEIILSSKLFNQGNFIHRTIAEFACAFYINNEFLKSNILTKEEKIKNLFVKNGKIPTELRGTYAWLCSISSNENFIKEDSYYQLLYGDNSKFDIELKKSLIKWISEEFELNPNTNLAYDKNQLREIYEEGLEDSLKIEFEKSKDKDDNYKYFIADFMGKGFNLSGNYKKYVKGLLEGQGIYYCKWRLLELFIGDREYLKSLLDKILNKEIDDKKNMLKDRILTELYPLKITPRTVAKYLNSYEESNFIGHCLYLKKTKYEDKLSIIEDLFQLKESRENYKLEWGIKNFIEGYLIETFKKYKRELNTEEIFEVLEKLKKIGLDYNSLDFSLGEGGEELANNLFRIYFDKCILNKNIEIYDIEYEFEVFFPFKKPKNIFKVVKNKLSEENSFEENIELFAMMFRSLSKKEKQNKELKELAKRYGLKEVYENLLNPKETPKEKERKKQRKNREKEEIEEKEKIKLKNEKYFSRKSDEEIANCFEDMLFIARLKLSKNENIYEVLEKKTRERLEKILKSLVNRDEIFYENKLYQIYK